MTEITTVAELDAALTASAERPVFLFKHSTACPVSAGALRRTREYFDKARADGAEVPPAYLIHVIENRAVSNAAAERLGVDHKSPQLILIDQRRAAWHTSHFNINAETIEKALGVRGLS